MTDAAAEATGSQELAVVSGKHAMQMDFTRVSEKFEAVEIEPMTTLKWQSISSVITLRRCFQRRHGSCRWTCWDRHR